jgi:ABC-type transport system involved in multi-copper enzyme maturation permease subunit
MIREILKEIKYGLRNNRFLILAASFLFFAVLTPVMMKVILPEVLKSQFPNMSEQELSGMMSMTQLDSIRSYMGDVFEVGSVIVAFTLCGLLAQEIKDNTLVMPLCSGKRFGVIVGAKMLVFGAALILSLLISLLVNFAYSGLLFSFDIGIMPIIRGGLLQGIFMVFLLSALIMWGALIKKPIAAGFMTLATVYGSHLTASAFGFQEYVPSGLLTAAQQLSETPADSLIKTLCITGAIILLFAATTLISLKKMEWNER